MCRVSLAVVKANTLNVYGALLITSLLAGSSVWVSHSSAALVREGV